MAVFVVKVEVLVEDGKTHLLTAKVKGRKNLDLRTVGVKALSKVIPMYYKDELEALDFVQERRKESFEWEDFAEDIRQELDIKMEKPIIEKSK